jgi:hypothetical protein
MVKFMGVGYFLKKWKTGKFCAKAGMNVLLALIVCISAALCVESFYFNSLLGGYQLSARVGFEVLAFLAITLYAEFVFEVVFSKWSLWAGVGTMYMLGIFLLFMVLGLITFIVTLWICVVQWWTNGLFSISFFPVLWAVALFWIYIIRRIVSA